jgi:LysR family nitrogen assimilation transcriptional regulator
VNLRQFRYFIEVVDAGSVSRAAASLRVAQPALSLQISNLEKELGTSLLVRGPRGVHPTAAGDICYRRARAVLSEIQHMRDELLSADGMSGEVSLGLTTSFLEEFADRIVSGVRAREPGVRLQIFDAASHVLEDSLLRGSLDIALLHDAAATHGLRQRPIFRQRLFYVEREGAGAVHATTVGISELVGRRLVLPTLPNATRIVVEAAFDAIGAKPVVAAEANSRNALLALVAGGADGTVLAWGGSPDPAYRWTMIGEPAVCHEVSLCTGRVLPLSDLRSKVEEIVEEIVMDTIRQPAWIGAEPVSAPDI